MKCRILIALTLSCLLTSSAFAQGAEDTEAPAAEAPAAEAPARPSPEQVIPEVKPTGEAKAPLSETPLPAATTPPATPPVAPAAKPKPRLMVLNLVDKGVGAALAKTLSDVVAGQALRSYRGEVVTTQQVKLALDASALQQLAGCDDDKCFLDIAEAAQASRVIGGSVSKVGDDVLITIRVVERATGKLVREESRKSPIVEDLYYYAAQQLTALVLTGQSTDNRVPVRIEADKGGAQVIVDGKAQGNAPVEMKLDPGAHEVIVKKADHVDWRSQVTIKELTPLSIKATLLTDRGSLWPLSITLTTLGVITLGGGVALGELSQNLYDGTHVFEFLDGDGYFFGPSDSFTGKSPASSVELQRIQQSVQLWRFVSITSYIVGGALTAGGVAVGVTEIFVGE